MNMWFSISKSTVHGPRPVHPQRSASCAVHPPLGGRKAKRSGPITAGVKVRRWRPLSDSVRSEKTHRLVKWQDDPMDYLAHHTSCCQEPPHQSVSDMAAPDSPSFGRIPPHFWSSVGWNVALPPQWRCCDPCSHGQDKWRSRPAKWRSLEATHHSAHNLTKKRLAKVVV